jgi:hypothetical protein
MPGTGVAAAAVVGTIVAGGSAANPIASVAAAAAVVAAAAVAAVVVAAAAAAEAVGAVWVAVGRVKKCLRVWRPEVSGGSEATRPSAGQVGLSRLLWVRLGMSCPEAPCSWICKAKANHET